MPLFDYFKDFSDVAFKVVADDYVTSDSGSGIVHCAPAFGEDDYRVCLENKIITKVHKQMFYVFRGCEGWGWEMRYIVILMVLVYYNY